MEPAQSWMPFLQSRVMQNRAARQVRWDADFMGLEVEVNPPRWLKGPLRWIFPIRRTRTVKLDPIGQRIWECCDPEAKVEHLVDRLAREERLTFHEARVAMTQYLETMTRRGALVVAIPRDTNS